MPTTKSLACVFDSHGICQLERCSCSCHVEKVVEEALEVGFQGFLGFRGSIISVGRPYQKC
jgi:hypothetical protein